MEKINVKVGVSHIGNHFSINYEDLGVTADSWAAMSQTKKEEALQKYVDDLPEQPYWVVEYFDVD